jgi:hypothetical protein
MPGRIRAKAGLPWPVTGTYACDKCHSNQIGQAGIIAMRCTAPRVDRTEPCNCAYFVLVAAHDRLNEFDGAR